MEGMNLQQELERAIGEGPALPLPGERLAAGRRALRRRRAGVAAAAAAAVVAVVVPVAVVAGGIPTSGREPTPAGPSPSQTSRTDGLQYQQSVPVDVDRLTRRLVLEEGVVVDERVDDVARGIVGWSAALDLTQGDRRYWVVLVWDETRADVHYDEVEPGRTGLSAWAETYLPALERKYAPGRAPSRPVPGLSWEGDRFVATGSTEVVEQRSPVDLGEGFAPDEAVTGAAVVDLDGFRMLVLYRELPGAGGQLLTNEDIGDRDLDAALALERETYAEVAP
jgi:hypothetical protein